VRTIDLVKSIDERPVLRGISLAIAAGEYVAVLGANGAGKSTLLRVLATLTPPTGGRVELFGQATEVGGAGLRARIGLIAHQSMLYRDLSAIDNLVFFARLYGLGAAAARDRAGEMLATVGLAHRAADPVKAFSRGMVQRLAIARALLHDPDLLLADEPFAGLDAPSTASLEDLLARLNGDGRKTVVLVNHDVDQSLRLASRAVVLRGGRVALDESTCRLYPREVLSEVSP
jgi:ABC-type multidrug transport system ATPase subunit